MAHENKVGMVANLGLLDGSVNHQEVNEAIAKADKVILFGEQNRLPYFTEDERLPKLHAGDPLVLRFWKVLEKLPETYREALFERAISVTLVRGESLLFFENYRRHQALHLGLRRRTIYLPEVLFEQAQAQGYDHWALAEGILFAAWILLDYQLLVDVIDAYGQLERPLGAPGLDQAALLRRLVAQHNLHRLAREAEAQAESEVFIAAYCSGLGQISHTLAQSQDPFILAHRVFDAAGEMQWAHDKTERIAEVFRFPRLFFLERDVIHGAAGRMATAQGQDLQPQSFADVLHDYKDALRFEAMPLLADLGKGVVPKPQATFIQALSRLGADGLIGYFCAYAAGDTLVMDLVHILWKHLCGQSSDPAGVYTRVGRCRALAKAGTTEGLEAAVAGILIRLDLAPQYSTLVAQVGLMGAVARQELTALVETLQLQDEDEWAAFKLKKKGIVLRALEQLAGFKEQEQEDQQAIMLARRSAIHEDPRVVALLADRPHRFTSDPTAVLMYWRAYRRLAGEFGAADPDVNFLLASLLIRMDRAQDFPYFLEQLPRLGPPAVSALYHIFENMSADDQARAKIWQSARQVLAGFLLKQRSRTRKKAS
jgi:hypothetical protein